ncbi:hypothetical protein SAY87_026784 [Trapa incisa]|uniref:FAS1 domain-containing protein n=1 Tax=Trapa incisa TaxID=236973 RepID=A0AAN7JM45_9MYRT|nr:hypothetical protein SAY87_026784 [Trapa incisa]
MEQQFNHLLFSITLICLLAIQKPAGTSAQGPATAVPSSGPINITQILEKAGQFTTFMRLLKSTQEANQIDTMLGSSSSNQGLTIFAPTDNAFNSLPSGTLNSLSDQQKIQLVQFHILPTLISTTQFQTVSNPLRTQVGNADNGQFQLNVSTSGSQVNLTTGVVTTTISNTILSGKQLAVYQVDKVLLPLAMFGAPPSPAPAPDGAPNTPSSLPKSAGGSSTDTSSAAASQVAYGSSLLAAALIAL